MTLDYIAQLPAGEGTGQLRQQALAAYYGTASQPTELIGYTSAGNCLLLYPFRVVGDEERALELAARLPQGVKGHLLITGVAPGEDFELREQAAARGVVLEAALSASVQGYLGNFKVAAQVGDRELDLARRMLGRPAFDLVLDLHQPPLLAAELPPPGYYPLGAEGDDIAAVLEQLVEQVGEFEKPRYVVYDAEICAHGRNGKRGCQRCLDVCPSAALSSDGGASILLDEHLCQGAGPCSNVCPNGALSYRYPAAGDLLGGLRAALLPWAGGPAPTLLIHDSESGARWVEARAGQLPEHLLPLQVEETGTAGAEFWLAALAWGAAAVIHLLPADTPPAVGEALGRQLRWCRRILEGLGMPAARLSLLDAAPDWDPAASSPPQPALTTPARHAALADKRNNLGLALDHLSAAGPDQPAALELTADAPFGSVEVDRQACTLCLACVSTCPSGALLDGGDEPKLRFIEERCLQCGLCLDTCPETAVSLRPRWLRDAAQRRAVRVLHEDEPALCVSCGKPFGNRRMITRMQDKLGGHWMYRDPAALRRLQMCDDCRILDIYAQGGGINVYDKD